MISGTIASNKIWKDYGTAFIITLHQTVSITESFYLTPSLSTLFASLGGSLGLWLGVGLLQICFLSMDVLKYIKRFVCKN